MLEDFQRTTGFPRVANGLQWSSNALTQKIEWKALNGSAVFECIEWFHAFAYLRTLLVAPMGIKWFEAV